MDKTELLARECQCARAKVMNSIISRKQHPSYGYTKALIREEVAHLEGLLYAYHLVTGHDPTVYLPSGARQAAAALDIDLNDIRARADRA